MTRRLSLTALVLFALVVMLAPQAAMAVPPDCDCDWCFMQPDRFCRTGPVTVRCKDWGFYSTCGVDAVPAPEPDALSTATEDLLVLTDMTRDELLSTSKAR